MHRSLVILALVTATLSAAEPPSAERGRHNAGPRAFNPPIASRGAYDRLWRQWGLSEKPADYERQVRERYGLHDAPYANGDLPLGLHPANGLLGKGIGNDCNLCHSGRVAGHTVLGLGNASLDIQSLFEDLGRADGIGYPLPFPVSNARGTIEAAAAVFYLLQFRDDELNVGVPRPLKLPQFHCADVPAWWLTKRKKMMYHTGSVDSRSVRTLMSFLLNPLNSAEYVKGQYDAFADIRAHIHALEAPKYPFAVDASLAGRGRELFQEHCVKCHGTYGPGGVYPGKVIPVAKIGTDPRLVSEYDPVAAERLLGSWIARATTSEGERLPFVATDGYQAPPLDGVWATAPYFHNGSVPTVEGVLNSKARPRIYTRSYRTEEEDYDPVKLGLRIQVLEHGPDPKAPARERRRVYDTTQPGRVNGGHTYGDVLTDEERRAVIEYLKTI